MQIFQSILEKSSKREVDDNSEVKAEYAKLMEVHSNMEAKLAGLSADKVAVEEKFKRLYDEHESMKTRYDILGIFPRPTKAILCIFLLNIWKIDLQKLINLMTNL